MSFPFRVSPGAMLDPHNSSLIQMEFEEYLEKVRDELENHISALRPDDLMIVFSGGSPGSRAEPVPGSCSNDWKSVWAIGSRVSKNQICYLEMQPLYEPSTCLCRKVRPNIAVAY